MKRAALIQVEEVRSLLLLFYITAHMPGELLIRGNQESAAWFPKRPLKDLSDLLMKLKDRNVIQNTGSYTSQNAV